MSIRLSRSVSPIWRRRTGYLSAFTGWTAKNRCIGEIRTRVPLLIEFRGFLSSSVYRLLSVRFGSFPIRLRDNSGSSGYASIVSVGYRYKGNNGIIYSVGGEKQTQKRYFFSAAANTDTVKSVARAKEAKNKMPETLTPFQRLPDTVKPVHYRLRLIPNIDTLLFKGDVSVEIQVEKATNEIVLNALDLIIEHVQIKGDKILTPENITLANNDTATFKFSTPITPGRYVLDISFKGEISDKTKGLYRSRYTRENGEDAYSVVTQFEPTDARRCFPCWDEPALKATFDITLVVPKNLVALSNMPIKKQETDGQLVTYYFDKTPIMSTYLVAVVIGEYDYVEDRSSDGVLVRVYTPKGKKEQGRFALEAATKVLPYYKEYFNIAYPLPKIDLITVADFSAGAMENWGLVTYRESTLLVDPENTSTQSKQCIALVVGHELAHQWFGNLVTMEWWTHLWLNEGYASFVEFLCVDYLFPEYNIWTQFVNDSYIKALELDSLNNSHPIEVPVDNPAEIDEIFDDISYNKGASVIRMLHQYIGDADFRKGMTLYLTKYQYKNTYTEDLWQTLEEASKKQVGKVMSTWTKQMGFPEVSITCKLADKGIVLTLSQTKFTADGSKPSGDYLWMIPVSITTCKNPGKEVISTVLTEKNTDILVPDVTENDWIKINPGAIGFYRTRYPSEMLEKFVPAIKDKSLPPLDRLDLVDDLFAMVRAGHTSTVEVLKFLRAFEDETDYNVWSSINNILGRLSQLLGCTPCAEGFNKYQKRLLHKVHSRLGWNSVPGETHLNTLLRGIILGRMALLNDEKNIEEAKTRLERHVSGQEMIPADLRSACYRTALRVGGQKEFDMLLKIFRETDLHEEKDRICKSLGVPKDVGILRQVLEFSMSDEVRSQDKIFGIASVAFNSSGRELAWNFMKANLTALKDHFSGYLFTRLIKSLTENFTTEERALEVEAFFRENSEPSAERTVQQVIETIRLNQKWLQRDGAAIEKYLGDF